MKGETPLDKNTPPPDTTWKVDRHIPIALIVSTFAAMLGQGGFILWWASQMDARVAHIELIQRTTPNPADRLVRLEVRFDNMIERLVEIKQLMTTPPRRP